MFKDELKKAMEAVEMNATSLSVATGIGKSSISQYLSGRNDPPDKKKEILAVGLGLESNYFLKESIQEIITKETPNLPVMTAAQLMGKSKEFIYQGLRDGVFPWGYGVKMGRNWSYYISPVMFAKHTGLTT